MAEAFIGLAGPAVSLDGSSQDFEMAARSLRLTTLRRLSPKQLDLAVRALFARARVWAAHPSADAAIAAIRDRLVAAPGGVELSGIELLGLCAPHLAAIPEPDLTPLV